MAKEEKEEKEEGEEKAKESKGMPKMLIFVAAGVVVLIIAIVVSYMVAKSVKAPKMEFGVERAEEKPPPPEPLEIGNIGEEEIIARLADQDEPHLVKVNEIYLAYDKKLKALGIELNNPARKFQIRDIFNTVLMSHKSTDLITEEGRNELKGELIKKINDILIDGQIKDIYMQIVVQ